MAKTVEELKSMTTEDLIRYAQELQEELEKEKESKKYIYENYRRLQERYDAMRDGLKSIINLTNDERPY